MSSKEMRGLSVFIQDLRSAQTKEQEASRVQKELANIRAKFTSTTQLSDYDKKKYVWKLLYIALMGYDIEIGHMVAIGMIGSKNFTVKQVGYLACSVLFTEKSELLRLMIQTIRIDMTSSNDAIQGLALACVGNLGGKEFAETLMSDVQRILFSPQTRAVVRKKAALCLLRMIRKCPEMMPQDADFPARIMSLLDDGNIGVLTAITSLLLGVASQATKGYEDLVPKAVTILTKLCFADARNKSVYKYYNTICPWLQVKLLKLLQYFPPTQDKSTAARLSHVIAEIINRTVITQNLNKDNADHAILFEAINLVVSLARRGTPLHLEETCKLLGKFVAIRDPNFRYMGLEAMRKLALLPEMVPTIRTHQTTILASLKDADVSLRKRALDLLFAICDKSNCEDIVDELMSMLQLEGLGMREELVLKVAILAEKYAPDLQWYVDTVMKLVSYAGAFVTDDIWFRIVQIITNNDDLQDYAASRALLHIQDPELHENGVKLMGYVLGEFAYKITDATVAPEAIYGALKTKYKQVGAATRALLLTAFCKMANTYPELKQAIDDEVLRARTNAASLDTEVQQRASEYLHLAAQNEDFVEAVLNVMPRYEDRDEDALMKRVQAAAAAAADRDVWTRPEALAAEEEDEEEDAEEQGAAGASGAGGDDAAAAAAAEDNDDMGHSDADPFPVQKPSLVQKALRGDVSKSPDIYLSRALAVAAKVAHGDSTSQAKMIIVVVNKSAHTMSDVQLHLPQSEVLKGMLKPASIASLAPGAQDRFLVLWSVYRPYDAPPPAKLTFSVPADMDGAATSASVSVAASTGSSGSSAGGLEEFDLLGIMGGASTPASTVNQMSVALRLPLLAPSFTAPNAISGAQYLPTWKGLAHQVVGKVRLDAPVSTSLVKQLAEKSLNLAVVTGCDDNEQNIYTAGTFCTNTKTADGRAVTIPVMARIETRPNVYVARVTVTAGHAAVADAFLKAISHVLLGRLE
jgi:hypothetical protein